PRRNAALTGHELPVGRGPRRVAAGAGSVVPLPRARALRRHGGDRDRRAGPAPRLGPVRVPRVARRGDPRGRLHRALLHGPGRSPGAPAGGPGASPSRRPPRSGGVADVALEVERLTAQTGSGPSVTLRR